MVKGYICWAAVRGRGVTHRNIPVALNSHRESNTYIVIPRCLDTPKIPHDPLTAKCTPNHHSYPSLRHFALPRILTALFSTQFRPITNYFQNNLGQLYRQPHSPTVATPYHATTVWRLAPNHNLVVIAFIAWVSVSGCKVNCIINNCKSEWALFWWQGRGFVECEYVELEVGVRCGTMLCGIVTKRIGRYIWMPFLSPHISTVQPIAGCTVCVTINRRTLAYHSMVNWCRRPPVGDNGVDGWEKVCYITTLSLSYTVCIGKIWK